MSRGAIYAVQLANGIVKIGRTDSPRCRWKNIRHETKQKQVRWFCSPVMDNGSNRVEKMVLQKASQMFLRQAKREYFECFSFGAVENLIKQEHEKFYGQTFGWRRYQGCDPLTKRDSGGHQRAMKAGRWKCSDSL